ncbi:MAG: tetratricopeptide repeat protein [Fimbriimonadaceae bacterium]|nr:tetratricopeptide repeat protein [Fimbriimonadaceae bacterium]
MYHRSKFPAGVIALTIALILGLVGWSGARPQSDFERARTLYSQGKFAEAKAACDQILAKEPHHAGALNTRGCAKHELGQYQSAIEDFLASLAVDDKRAVVHANLGRSYRVLKQYGEAIAAFCRAIELDSKYAEHYVGRGINRLLTRDPAGALKDFDEAVQLDPKLARGHDYRNQALLDLRRYPESLAAVERAIALDPKVGEYHYHRAIALRRVNRLEDALKTLDEAMRLGYKSGSVHNERGLTLMSAKRYQDALIELETALKLSPNSATILGNRGRCFFYLDNLERAAQDIDAAIEMEPENAGMYRYRAELREKKGDLVGAATDIRRTLSNDPRDERAAEIARRLGVPTEGYSGIPEQVAEAFGLPTPGVASLPKDVTDESQWPKGDQLWKPPVTARLTPPAIPPVEIPPQMEFGKLPLALYNWAITTAKEGMRAVIGPMSAVEEQKFESKWAVYYDSPVAEVVDYVNRLNPLLAKFLEARSGFTLSAQQLGRSLDEAGLLAESRFGGPAAVSIDAARYYKSLMAGYEAAMRSAVVEIEALGPMPNPFEARRKRAKELQDELKRVEKKAAKPAVTPQKAIDRYFVLEKVEASARPTEKQSLTYAEGLVSVSARHGDENWSIVVQGEARWEAMPRVVPYDRSSEKNTIKLSTSGNVTIKGVDEQTIKDMDMRRSHGIEIDLKGTNVEFSFGSSRVNGEVPGRVGTGRLGELLYQSVDNALGLKDPELGAKAVAIIQVESDAGSVTFAYSYRLASLTPDQVNKIKAEVAKDKPELEKEQAEAARLGAENAAKMDRVAYLKETRKAFSDDRARLLANLGTADPSSRKELALQMMYADAMMHAADDSLFYAETGQWRRTRTLYDEYDLHRMMEISRQEAQRVATPMKVLKAAEAQIQIAPEHMRYELKERLRKGLTPEMIRKQDVAGMRSLANGIANDVSAYWAKKGEAESFNATLYGVAEEGTKIGAGIVILGAGSLYVAGYGVSAVTIWAADTLMGAVYGGVSGYVEGGPDEACRKSLQWAGMVGFAATEALDAYGGGESKGDIVIAAGRAVALGKAFEYGGKFVGGFFRGRPSVQESFAIAKFQQELEWGQALLQRSQRAQTAMAEATAKGVTGTALRAAERELAEATAAVNGSYHAKLLLKYGGDRAAAGDFIREVEALYGRVQPDFLANLKSMGYDVSNLKFAPIRNASSAGSVGMDLDLALIESAGLVIKKDGKVVSMAVFGKDAQKAYNKAYFRHTGYSAEQSLVNVTSSAHREAFTSRMAQETIPFESLTALDRTRAAEVLLAKTRDMPLTGMTKAIEAARATEKELRNRVLPDLATQLAEATKRGDKAAVKELQASRAYWEGIRKSLEKASQCERDPYKMWQALDEVRGVTGGKDIFGLAEALGYYWKTVGR